MSGKTNNRANWKRKFELDRTSPQLPLVKFAKYARDKGTPQFRRALILLDGFGAAFDAELAAVDDENVLEDLTAEERAFCEGWAFLARRQLSAANSGDVDDAKLLQWIDDQLKSPPWPENTSG